MAAYMNVAKKLPCGATMTVLASSPLSLLFSAADVKGQPATPETKPKKLLRPSELPIYEVHGCHCGNMQQQQQLKSTYGNVVSSTLEFEIGRARRSIVGNLDGLKDTKDRALIFYETGKAHTLDTVAYLRDDSNILARVGAISVGGLVGLLLAARRGFFKKLFYGGSGMAAIASLCYPNEAGQISKGVFTIAKYYAYMAYQKLEDEVRNRASSSSVSSSETSKPVKNLVNHVTSNEPAVLHSDKEKKVKLSGDFGQSHPGDADLYTTRTS